MKDKRFKKLIAMVSVLLTVIFLLPPIPAPASPLDGGGMITPMWVHVSGIDVTLALFGNDADCYGVVSAYFGTQRIDGTLTLYRQSGSGWVNIKSWDKTTDTSSKLIMTETYPIASGYNYKLVFQATVVRNGSSETIKTESSVKYCS